MTKLQEGKELVIATRNAGKKREFQQMLEPLGFRVLSLADYPQIPEIEETGTTFAENAQIKARTTAKALNVPVIADDSGLAVEKLQGAPGVYSARYAGEGTTDERNNRKLLSELKRIKAHNSVNDEVKLRSGGIRRLLSEAAFICSIVYIAPAADGFKDMVVTEGRLEGWILDEPSGEGGFGYDPLFYVPEYGATLAELSGEQKNTISHRGQALQRLMEELRRQIG